jgi:hypothetical protein
MHFIIFSGGSEYRNLLLIFASLLTPFKKNEVLIDIMGRDEKQQGKVQKAKFMENN